MIQSPYNIIHVFHIMCFKDKTHKIGYLNTQIDQAHVNTIAYICLVESIISDFYVSSDSQFLYNMVVDTFHFRGQIVTVSLKYS